MNQRNSVAAAGLIVALITGILVCRTPALAGSIEAPLISIERARQMMSEPNVVIIDVRTPKTWWRSPTKIANAVREELNSVEQWAPKYTKDKTLIFYCS
jgi:hypothetical protein